MKIFPAASLHGLLAAVFIVVAWPCPASTPSPSCRDGQRLERRGHRRRQQRAERTAAEHQHHPLQLRQVTLAAAGVAVRHRAPEARRK